MGFLFKNVVFCINLQWSNTSVPTWRTSMDQWADRWNLSVRFYRPCRRWHLPPATASWLHETFWYKKMKIFDPVTFFFTHFTVCLFGFSAWVWWDEPDDLHRRKCPLRRLLLPPFSGRGIRRGTLWQTTGSSTGLDEKNTTHLHP